MKAVAVVGLFAGVILVASGCSDSAAPEAPDTASPASVTPSAPAPTITSTVAIASGLKTPWGVAFLPDGSALFTDRDDGIINLVAPKAGGLASVTPVGQVQSVNEGGEGGLLGIAMEPGKDPKEAFVYYTTPSDNRIATMTWDGKKLGSPSPILTGIPAAQIHNGGRIAFGPDGYLYAGTGDAGQSDRAQDVNNLGGKILRITTAGRPAPGNPFDNSPVWSLGHRNVQGLAFDSKGRLWNSEFGQNLHDELNLVTKGANFGWPIHEGIANDPKYADPYVQWPTSEASPSGLAIVGDWAYMAALRGRRLWQIGIAGPSPVGPNPLLVGEYGRLRTPTLAPDGSLWLTTSNTDGRANPAPDDDKILQLKLS
ncbi:MAG: PQQ-dependent sugar dehydrogenase [Candidatus Nanopelagicales bacterium]